MSAIPVVLVGAGAMGRAWMRNLTASVDADMVGVVDLDLDLARRAIADERIGEVALGTSVSDVASRTGARAVVNVTVPAAHRAVNEEALRAGLAVLCEKPIAPMLAEALAQAALAEATGQLLMVSQSRRYYRALTAFRHGIRDLGDVGILTTDFFRAPHFGGFREEMAQPLLVDMAIHPFDAARYLLDAEPLAVRCSSWNPSWSWFRGDAAATAEFEFAGGTRYIYTGSWCSPGLETSWNGTWRASGGSGTTTWDGESAPVSESGALPMAVGEGGEEIAGSLAAFVTALRTGEEPDGEVHRNIPSLAMVEAAVRSAETGERIVIADLLESAWRQACADETAPDVRDRLTAWRSAETGLFESRRARG